MEWRNLRYLHQFFGSLWKFPCYKKQIPSLFTTGDIKTTPQMMADAVFTFYGGIHSLLVGLDCITWADLSIIVKLSDYSDFGFRKSTWWNQFLESGLNQLKYSVLSPPAENDLRNNFEWLVNYHDLLFMPIRPPSRDSHGTTKLSRPAKNLKYV